MDGMLLQPSQMHILPLRDLSLSFLVPNSLNYPWLLDTFQDIAGTPRSHFPLQLGSPTTTNPTLKANICPLSSKRPHHSTPLIPHPGCVQAMKRPSFYFSLCAGIWVTSDEGSPSFFRNTWWVHCTAIPKMRERRHNSPPADEAALKVESLICLV